MKIFTVIDEPLNFLNTIFKYCPDNNVNVVQVGLSRAQRLAQGQTIKIQLLAALPVHIDGEPWFQEPCTLHISDHGQVLFCPLLPCQFCLVDSIAFSDKPPIKKKYFKIKIPQLSCSF